MDNTQFVKKDVSNFNVAQIYVVDIVFGSYLKQLLSDNVATERGIQNEHDGRNDLFSCVTS